METLRTELNSNEKLALSLTGMEGTGEHFILNGEAADQTLLREKQEKFNTSVDELEDKFSKHNQALEDYAKSLSNDMNGVEIMPMYGYALIKPFEQNPFQKIKTTKSGLITDLGGFTPTYKSNETGEIEEEQQFIMDFFLNSGSIKEMARLRGNSYPTMRNYMDDLIGKVKKLVLVNRGLWLWRWTSISNKRML